MPTTQRHHAPDTDETGGDVYEVAVVVFTRAPRVDDHDAANRATQAIADRVHDDDRQDSVEIGAVLPLGTALDNGYLTASPARHAYRR